MSSRGSSSLRDNYKLNTNIPTGYFLMKYSQIARQLDLMFWQPYYAQEVVPVNQTSEELSSRIHLKYIEFSDTWSPSF